MQVSAGHGLGTGERTPSGTDSRRGPAFWVVAAALVGLLGYFGTWASLEVGSLVSPEDFKDAIPNSTTAFFNEEGSVEEQFSSYGGPEVIGAVVPICLVFAVLAAFAFGIRPSREVAFAALIAGAVLLVVTALKLVAINGIKGQDAFDDASETDTSGVAGDPGLVDSVATIGWGGWLAAGAAIGIVIGAIRFIQSAPPGWSYLDASRGQTRAP